MYVCPSEPHTPSPSFGHSSSVRHLHVTEPSAFPLQAALFLQSFARSHGPIRIKDTTRSVTQGGRVVKGVGGGGPVIRGSKVKRPSISQQLNLELSGTP